MIGTVKWFNAANGYGFITPDDGSDDCFVHVTALQASGLKQLVEDQRVQYDMQEGRNGRLVACDLSILPNDVSQAAE